MKKWSSEPTQWIRLRDMGWSNSKVHSQFNRQEVWGEATVKFTASSEDKRHGVKQQWSSQPVQQTRGMRWSNSEVHSQFRGQETWGEATVKFTASSANKRYEVKQQWSSQPVQQTGDMGWSNSEVHTVQRTRGKRWSNSEVHSQFSRQETWGEATVKFTQFRGQEVRGEATVKYPTSAVDKIKTIRLRGRMLSCNEAVSGFNPQWVPSKMECSHLNCMRHCAWQCKKTVANIGS